MKKEILEKLFIKLEVKLSLGKISCDDVLDILDIITLETNIKYNVVNNKILYYSGTDWLSVIN